MNPISVSAESVAQRILEMIKERFTFKSIRIDFVTTTIGISIFPLNGKEVEGLLQMADSRMYEAKKKKCLLTSYLSLRIESAAHQRSLESRGVPARRIEHIRARSWTWNG